MFNINFRNIRLKQGLSQKQVADHLNISPQSVSKWEKGEALPSIEFLPKMAECLNCEINDFFVQNSNTFNMEMLKKFFDYMTGLIVKKTKQAEDIEPILTEYPDITDVYAELGDALKQYQKIKRNNIQGILNCSDADTDIFIKYFVDLELIEKLDSEDCYFVHKDGIDSITIILLKIIETCNIIRELNKLKELKK